LIECLRGFFLTGFPWLGLAEAQVNGPFGLIAPYLGGLACTFLTVWSSWQLLHIRKHVIWSIAPVALVVTLVQIMGLWSFTKPTGSPLSIELVQGNFSQSLIFRPEGVMQQIDYYSNVMKRSSAELLLHLKLPFHGLISIYLAAHSSPYKKVSTNITTPCYLGSSVDA